MQRILKIEILYLICMITLYGTYAFSANPIADDWWLIDMAQKHTSWANLFHYWITTIPHRPVYAVLLASSGWAFKGNMWMYVLLTSTAWCSAVFISAHALQNYLNKQERWVYIFLASVPILSAATLFASVQMIALTFAFLFWSISFLFQLRSYEGFRSGSAIISFIFASMALLSYEAVLPLIAFSFCISLLQINFAESGMLKYPVKILTISWPQWASLILVLLYKKIMSVAYPGFILNMESRSFSEKILSIGDWFLGLFVGFPILVFSSLTKALTLETLIRPTTVILIIIYVLIPIVISRNPSLIGIDSAKNRGKFFLITIICLVSSIAIFFVSGYSARIEGLSSRLWGGTWILLCMIFSMVFGKILMKPFGKYLIGLCFGLVALSYCVQMHAYIRASKTARSVIDSLYKESQENGYRANQVIIANVPRYLPDNLNGELVMEGVYLAHGLSARYPQETWRVIAIWPPAEIVHDSTRVPWGYQEMAYFNWIGNEFSFFRPRNIIQREKIDNGLWFFEYDVRTHATTMTKYVEPSQFYSRIADMNQKSGNTYSKPVSEQVRDEVKTKALEILGKSDK